MNPFAVAQPFVDRTRGKLPSSNVKSYLNCCNLYEERHKPSSAERYEAKLLVLCLSCWEAMREK